MSDNNSPSELEQKIASFSLVNEYFKEFLNKCNIKGTSNKDLERIFKFLGNLLFQPEFTSSVVTYFRKQLLCILTNSVTFEGGTNSNDNVRISVALAKLIKIHPDAENFTFIYFKYHPAPFDETNEKSFKKKFKLNVDVKTTEITDLDVVLACYTFLKHCPGYFKNQWKWTVFIEKFSNHEVEMVKWLCYRCIQILLGINEAFFNNFMQKNFSEDAIWRCTIEYENKRSIEQNHLTLTDTNVNIEQETELGVESKRVVCISGIYLPIYQKVKDFDFKLIEVNSTKSNLHRVTLGVVTNKAVCLQGPVGSGKTFLIEYLAVKTGRILGESFIKVQLGDQTDSKMLLGTYKCTDIPGEFVWQPGVLTQAVIEGSWLLLEDIDLASMDIASVLTALIENKSLNVPGYRDSIQVSPNFQLFLTRRSILTSTGYHQKHSNVTALLEKNILQINIDPLSSSELEEIIKALYPNLQTIAARMVNTFMSCTISSNKGGRLISVRDLFKWCSRATIDFDVTSQNSALNVLQDAIDIFCCASWDANANLKLACEISSHLGIINEKTEYFCKRYKPSLSLTADSLKSGRVSLLKQPSLVGTHINFCFTRPSACLLERIMCCVYLKEPVLLVGETGTGKTSVIQYLAHTLGYKLIVINMNQQSDSADLLGGYKPVDMKFLIAPLKNEFVKVFTAFYSIPDNEKFLNNIDYCFNRQKWMVLIKLMQKCYAAAMKRLVDTDVDNEETGRKRPYPLEERSSLSDKNKIFLQKWSQIGIKLEKLEAHLRYKNDFAFSFIEGSLVKAIKNGYWVLLDEINLASPETLECLSGLLEGSKGSLSLLERGDKKPIKRHSKFTLFACMNPSTDVGKRDLPIGLRNRFTEFFVDELTDKQDLLLLVDSYLNASSLSQMAIENIVKFYLNIRKEAQNSLSDGLGHKPHFSLRTLCRALMIAERNSCGVLLRSLYEAFSMSFLTQLNIQSYKIVEGLIMKFILGSAKDAKSILKQPIEKPKPNKFTTDYVNFEGYWVATGVIEIEVPDNYVLTNSVRKNLKDLVRVVSIGKSPVLLQGDTSVGKTSLITYLAKSSGNKCVRINNHEHTDLQEYIGSYIADTKGKLVFREGLLVEAMRKGHWIILDELNLAPTDVLEALNRVLDDNRELFIPETQEIVKAHPNFKLFATQNPPGLYGGRKMLSRAFRNRFVELHFNEIPSAELEFILHKRCEIPPSYAKKMVAVMTDLQTRRRGSAAFAGKQGFITLRDLFRWGERYRLAQNTKTLYDWDQHLADEGYLLLAGRVRKNEEKDEISVVLQKHMKREVLPQNLFTLSDKISTVTKHVLEKLLANKEKFKNIVWTYNLRKLAVLVSKAMEFREPVLLIGETGGGKTTVCQLIAETNNQILFTINCHMHTESSDFIGGLRPVRDHSDDNLNKLFEWIDGPLIQAMVKGGVFLADEISLADDSVLERLNSLLESERTLLLAEKGTDINNPTNSELILAHDSFHFVGTMNPGGDYGKKELSPALRNRFTEIWCDPCTERDDIIDIIEQNLYKGISLGNQEDGRTGIGRCIMDFIDWFKDTEIGKRFTISIRDILTWVNFINACSERIEVADAYLQGAFLTFLDSLGSGITSMESIQSLDSFQDTCISFIVKQLRRLNLEPTLLPTKYNLHIERKDEKFGIKPFYLALGSNKCQTNNFAFEAPTCSYNTLRLLRGLQLSKAILLEGSPGVGKTSLVNAIAKASGHHILRINLSDQTDISDLFGADLPVEGGAGGQFAWRDGPFLRALKQGHWILLDELNLASQSVLEGLNACLDHRGEIFIPELGKTFNVKQGTRLFACQNPLKQGGSRRGLPQSFLNRFTQVYVNPLNAEDLLYILTSQFPSIPKLLIKQMIDFNSHVTMELEKHTFGLKGAPWEFNLRDMTRWCEAVMVNSIEQNFKPEDYVQLIYSERMRTVEDKKQIVDIFQNVCKLSVGGVAPVVYLSDSVVHIGDVSLSRESKSVNTNLLKPDNTLVLRNQVNALRSLAYCVKMNWMAILVGSSGVGKSNVVRTMANLTGRTLRTLPVTSAMDTTDILGGFEQTDYTRHLEDIVRHTESILMEVARDCFLDNHNGEAIQIMRMWEYFTDLLNTDSKNKTMSEETQLFLAKLNKLDNIWQHLQRYIKHGSNVEDRLIRIREKGKNIFASIKKEGDLNAGGKFEWVDSVLIKCLQDGSWLLIDNVNLCNPAVLDRLNALLEPNGVLTIGERGVMENGKLVEIKPHEDFRLFLTMDPKNGEISRAMRNRGIEIYMLESNDNLYDIKSLISNAGLKYNKYIEALLQMHNIITDMALGEKPSLNQLLQASFLISQQLLRGKNIYNAFYYTLLDVYRKYQSSQPDETIEQKLKEILNSGNNPELEFYSEDVTLKTENVSINSCIEEIKQQSVLAKHHPTNIPNQLRNFLINFYSIASSKDLKCRHAYILSQISDPLVKLVCKHLYETILEYSSSNNIELPYDPHWLPDSVYKNSLNASNRLYLLMYFNITKLIKHTEDENKTSLLAFLDRIQRKQVECKIDDVLEKDLVNLFETFDYFTSQCLKDQALNITDLQAVEMISLLQWRYRLYQLTDVDVKQIALWKYKDIFTNLHVHYRWFYKFSVKQLFDVLKIQIDEKLKQTTNKVNCSSLNAFSLRRISKSFQRNINGPPPLINDKQMKIENEYEKILKNWDLYNGSNDVKKVLSVLYKDKNLRMLLIKAKRELNYELSDIPEIFDVMQKELYQYTNIESEDSIEINKFQFILLSDYFAKIAVNKLKSCPGKFIEGNQIMLMETLSVPIQLAGIIERYNLNKDVRLIHECKSEVFNYLSKALSINFHKYLDAESDFENKLNTQLSPNLTVLLNKLVVDDLEKARKEILKVTEFGDYRRVLEKHKKINLLLWRNLLQMSSQEYDVIYCELTYVCNSFTEFIQQLANSLNVTFSDVTETVQKCIESIQDIYSNANNYDTHDDYKTLILLLEKSIVEFEVVSNFSDDTRLRRLHFISNLQYLISYLKALFNSRLPTIDPLVKKKLKKQYCLQEIEEFSGLVKTYKMQNDIYSATDNTLHSHVAIINSKIDQLKNKNIELGKYVAVRPEHITYSFIIKEISYHFSVFLQPKSVLQLFNNLNEVFNTIQDALNKKNTVDIEKCKKYSREIIHYKLGCENLINIMQKYRCNYPDIIQTLFSNLTEFLYVLKIKTTLCNKLLMQYENMTQKITIEEDLVQVMRFPVLCESQSNYADAIKLYTNNKFQTVLNNTIQLDNPYLLKQESFRILKCGIQELFNISVMDGENSRILDEKLFQEFNTLLGIFVGAWKQQEEELELKKKQEESLYKIKPRSEDKQLEDDCKEIFPSFHEKDFSDIQENLLADDDDVDVNVTSKYVGVITLEDVKSISKMHTLILHSYTKTEWLSPSKVNVKCDFITPLIEKFKLFKLLLNKFSDCLDYTVDTELLNSLNILIAVAQRFGCTNISDEQFVDRTKTSYNFYSSPKIEEVKGSYHILEELRLQIQVFLQEWPEHPGLKTIRTVIERIYSFDITSPMSRFLTGFEILLTKCHEWEQNAHVGVSLSQHIQSLIQQIIAWRKMEMSVWKDSLNIAFERMNEPISKWWFYMYEIMQQFIQEDTLTIEELISTLQKFITSSNLAEFSNRLNLLLTFHYHAIHLQRCSKTDIFINLLWNVHEYFKQFLPNVNNKIKELRAPIENKLKEYIKIVKWKDISYWAVKDTLDKTHKILHKFIREFQDIIRQPVTSYLTTANVQEKQLENVGIWDRPQRSPPKKYHYTMDAATYMAKASLTKKMHENNEDALKQDTLLRKAEKYFHKSRLLTKKTILKTKYPNLIQRFDEFIGEIIESSIRLQNLEIDKSLIKSKQKSQAKSILQQKRKALSDLFKALATSGLSFRTGIVQTKLNDDGKQYLLRPIDLRAAFQHINCSRNDEKLLTIWEGCEIYYIKALSKLDNLDVRLQNPAKDLGIQNVERCKGYSKHSMSFAYDQKSSLIESSRTLYYLKYYFNHLTAISEGYNYIPTSFYGDVKEFLKNVITTIEQYKLILNTCPEEINLGGELYTVPILRNNTENDFISYKNDSLWNECYSSTINIIGIAKKLFLIIEKSRNTLPSANFKVINATFIPLNNISRITEYLDVISTKLSFLTTTFQNSPSINGANWLNNEANRIRTMLNDCLIKDEPNSSSKNADKLEKDTEQFLQRMLIVLQNIYKKYNENSDNINEEEDKDLLRDNHLKTLIINNLSEDFKILKMKSVLAALHNLLVHFYRFDEITKPKSILSQVLPVLDQIIMLYEYFVTQQVSAYRVTCKLSSVLMNIFIDLATKGFCIPPEFEEELSSEGQSQHAGGGLGLGDGEGEKDISDKIESEDQLEDAQPAGQEKEKEEDKDCKEEEKGIEMSEDFDSKLQDIQKGDDENDTDNSDNENDLNEQMGETDKGADQLDQEVWGSDNEDEEENQEQDHKEEKGSKGEKDGQDELGAKDDSAQPQDSEEANESKEKNKKDKEINEMQDAEMDDEQIDPYHGNHPEYPEPEAMDLPDDLDLDDGKEDNEDNLNEENPFDIDSMKEQVPPENETTEEKEQEEQKEENKNKDENSDDDGDDKDSKMDIEDTIEEEGDGDNDLDENKDKEKTKEKSEEENVINIDESEMDQTHTNETQLQPMEVENAEATDKVQANPSENQKSSQLNDEVFQEDNLDKDGVGQSRMEESKTGHKGQASAQQEMPSNRQEEEYKQEELKRKPGESDSKRSLGDANDSVKKKLKTIDSKDQYDPEEGEEDDKKEESEMYQHIKEAKENDVQVLDVATKEQAEQQKEVPSLEENEDDKKDEMDSSNVLPEDENEKVDVEDTIKQAAEKLKAEKKKNTDKGQHSEGDILEEVKDVEVEGDVIETMTVQRGDETTHHTQYSNLDENTIPSQLSMQEINQIRAEVEHQLSIWNEPPTSNEAEQAWEKISAVTSSLAQNLSEQLRLVLEPTQASHLKGDYRTGRRINMRKVIPYIASQFRKDKIWLRRTKPSKRDYQIALAIDDSSSMSDNHSKELAFESVALISKALTLLESGQLSVLSFGENTEVLHKLTDTFTEKSGSKLLQKFQFTQKKTCIAKLVDFVTEMLLSSSSQSNALIAKLLIIVSDGRGIFSEGESYVQQAVRRAKLSNIFMVFVIIDNPNNKDSILDIRMPVFKDGKLLGIKSYMDSFPFPFYIILKNINSLPNVLSDALRQWFEIVSNIDK